MVNESMPWQLTVGNLREVLATVPDEAVVALRVPPSGLAAGPGTTIYNLRVEYGGGVIVQLVPIGSPPSGR